MREGVIGESAVSRGIDRFSIMASRALQIDPSEAVRGEAEKVLRRYPIGSADAMQLASALVWHDGGARSDGFEVMPGR